MTDDYLDMLLERGRELARLHREVLPLGEVDFGAGGFGARIEPYRSELAPGGTADITVIIKNPLSRRETATVVLAFPDGWSAEPEQHSVEVMPLAEAEVSFKLRPAPSPTIRARIAAELRVGDRDFGQQAEALVTVL